MVDSKPIDTKSLAKQIRLQTLKMISEGGGSHIGAVFSIADIVAVLYGHSLNVYPGAPDHPDRDRFILSKGHAGAAVYAVLAELGFFDRSKLETYYRNGSDLSGHMSHRNVPGVELSTGSLGHGLGIAAGMAYAARLRRKNHSCIALLSDGECDAGSTWEAALFAGHHELDNLVAIIDYNKIQSLASVSETLELEPFADKWRSFGWAVREVNGHDHPSLQDAFSCVAARDGRPAVIIAHTIKGKGVSFMENSVLWHYRCPRGREFEAALRELEASE